MGDPREGGKAANKKDLIYVQEKQNLHLVDEVKSLDS